VANIHTQIILLECKMIQALGSGPKDMLWIKKNPSECHAWLLLPPGLDSIPELWEQYVALECQCTFT
jgi:hypothetical protein